MNLHPPTTEGTMNEDTSEQRHGIAGIAESAEFNQKDELCWVHQRNWQIGGQEPTVRLYVCAANVYRVRTLRLCNLFGRGSVHAWLLITSQLARPRLGMISSCCGCSQSRSIWSSTTTFNMYRSGNLPYQPEGTEIQKHINTYNIGLESLLTFIFLLYPTC